MLFLYAFPTVLLVHGMTLRPIVNATSFSNIHTLINKQQQENSLDYHKILLIYKLSTKTMIYHEQYLDKYSNNAFNILKQVLKMTQQRI